MFSFKVFSFNFIEPIIEAAQKKDIDKIIILIKDGYWFDLEQFIEPIQNIFTDYDIKLDLEVLYIAQKKAVCKFYEKIIYKSKLIYNEANEIHVESLCDIFNVNDLNKVKVFFLKEIHNSQPSLEYQIRATIALAINYPTKEITLLGEGFFGRSQINLLTAKILQIVFWEQFRLHLLFTRNKTYEPKVISKYYGNINYLINKYKKHEFNSECLDFLQCILFKDCKFSYKGWDLSFSALNSEQIDDYIKTSVSKQALDERNSLLVDNIIKSITSDNIIIVWAGKSHLPHTAMDIDEIYYNRTQTFEEMYNLAEKEYLLITEIDRERVDIEAVLSTKVIYERLKEFNIQHAHAFQKCSF